MSQWNYPRVRVVRVLDGDTVEALIDLGFRTHRQETLRLYGIDAPELKSETRAAGQRAKEHLLTLIESAARLSLTTIKDDGQDKYGRFLGVLWDGEKNLNQQMILDGHATERWTSPFTHCKPASERIS